MSRPAQMVSAITQALSGFNARRCVATAASMAKHTEALTDDELAAVCQTQIASPKLLPLLEDAQHGSPPGFRGFRLDDTDAKFLAALCETFRRSPPRDAPRGTRLYREQLLCAAHLMRGSLVQMDTGEGKTFSLMVAAAALLRRHSRVYVVTANPYLAIRDAHASVPFFHRLGVSVGVALPRDFPTEGWLKWEATVVYTTHDTLMFQAVHDDLQVARRHRRLSRAAVLVDEVDTVLLDDDWTYSSTRAVRKSDKARRLACSLAGTLDHRHVEQSEDPDALWVILNQSGQSRVRDMSGTLHEDAQNLGLYRDVECAYAGLFLAVEGRDYEVSNGGVVPLDPASGWRLPGMVPDWLPPLASHRQLRIPPQSQVRHAGSTFQVLLGADHFAGTSGTLIDEALEYLVLVGLPLAVIAPRTQRQAGRQSDRFFANFEGLQQHLCSVIARHASTRPVFVVASSSILVHRLHQVLRDVVPADAELRLAMGDSFFAQQQFEDAGRPGVVLVSTRQAGRGVDVRLDPDARANGGMLLVLVGHSAEPRHDRQLLGRVGRNGDPYTAYFCNYPGDDLLKGISFPEIVAELSSAEGLIIPPLERQLRAKQRLLRHLRLQGFTRDVAIQQAKDDLNSMLRLWRLRIQEANDDDLNLDIPFLRTLASQYVAGLPGLAADAVSQDRARATVLKLAATLEQESPDTRLELQLLGQPPGSARLLVTEYLVSLLDAACASNLERQDGAQRARELILDADRARALIEVLRHRLERLRAPAGPEETSLADEPPVERPFAALARYIGGQRNRERAVIPRDWVRQGLEARLSGRRASDDLRCNDPSPPMRWLHPIFVGILALPPHSHAPRSGRIDELARDLDELEVRLSNLSRDLPALNEYVQRLRTRNPKGIAHATVDVTSQVLAREQRRVRLDLRQRQRTGFAYQTAYCEALAELCSLHATSTVERLVRNINAGAVPERLDQLFASHDNAASGQQPSPIADLTIRFAAPGGVASSRPAMQLEAEGLIRSYLAAAGISGGEGHRLSLEQVVPALISVLRATTIQEMSRPEGVAAALGRWRADPARRELSPWRRRRVDARVREFLDYLHNQGLIARRPRGIQTQSKRLWSRVRARLGTLRLAASAFTVLGICLLSLLLNSIEISQPVVFDGWWRFFDLALSGGALSAGRALGPPLVGVLGGTLVGLLLHKNEALIGLSPVERGVAFAGAAGSALWILTEAGRSTHPETLALYLPILLVSVWVLSRLFWQAQYVARVPLAPGLIGLFTLAVAIPAVMASAAEYSLLPLVLIGAGTVAARRLSRPRLPIASLVSARNADGDVYVDDEVTTLAPSGLRVTPPVRWTAYCFCLLIATVVTSSVHPLLGNTGVRLLGPALFLLVNILWAIRLAYVLTDIDIWTRRLRFADQAYVGTASAPTLSSGLGRLRRQVVLREMLFGAAMVTGAILSGAVGDLFGGPVVHLGLLAATLGVVGTELALAFVLSLSSLTASGPVRLSPLDQENALSEGMLADVQDAVRLIARRIGVIVFAFLALRGIADLLSVWTLLRAGYNWVMALL